MAGSILGAANLRDGISQQRLDVLHYGHVSWSVLSLFLDHGHSFSAVHLNSHRKGCSLKSYGEALMAGSEFSLQCTITWYINCTWFKSLYWLDWDTSDALGIKRSKPSYNMNFFYQANEKSDCNCSVAHSIILHPCPSNRHSTLEVVCCWKYADQKVEIFAVWNRWWLQHFKIQAILQVLGGRQATYNGTCYFEVTRNSYLSTKPRFRALITETQTLRIWATSHLFHDPHGRRLPLCMQMK